MVPFLAVIQEARVDGVHVCAGANVEKQDDEQALQVEYCRLVF